MEPEVKKSKTTYNKDVIAKYTKYAIDNDVFNEGTNLVPDWVDDSYLVSMYNEHRQSYLLDDANSGRGYCAETSCGCVVYTNENARCDCGRKWVWNSIGFNPYDPTEFNIDSTEPYGYIDSY
jgi:hypothetical protein